VNTLSGVQPLREVWLVGKLGRRHVGRQFFCRAHLQTHRSTVQNVGQCRLNRGRTHRPLVRFLGQQLQYQRGQVGRTLDEVGRRRRIIVQMRFKNVDDRVAVERRSPHEHFIQHTT
jgi:hypothetical protein